MHFSWVVELFLFCSSLAVVGGGLSGVGQKEKAEGSLGFALFA